MAPALTEPLSPNNTLSASTSSASPRPSISNSTTNNFLKNTNHILRNGSNNTNKTDIKSISPLGSTATTIKPLNGIANNNINNTSKNFGIIENNNNINNSQKNSLFRRSLTSTCAFQSAFEESIKKAGFPLPEPQQKVKKTKNKLTSVAQSTLNRSTTPEDQERSNSPKENSNNTITLTKTQSTIGLKENFSNNFNKKVKTEPLYIHQNNTNNKISPKSGNNNNNTYSNNLNSIGQLTNGPSSLLSTSSIVCKSIETKPTSATTPSIKSNQTNKLMGPMSDTTQQDSHEILSEDFVTIPEEDQLQQSQQQSKNKNILQGFIPIDKNFEKVLKATLKVNNRNNNNKQDEFQCEGNEVEKLLLKLDDLQQMDLPNCNDNNDNNVNINDKTIVLSSNVLNVNDANIVVNKISNTIAIDDSCENVDGRSCRTKHGDDGSIIIECDSRNQQVDIEFSQEIRSTGTTETTVSASEGENNFLEDNFQETQALCHSQENTPNKLINRRSPPKTPTSSQQLSQIIGTPASSILTPQSIGLGSSAMGLQKDFKDSEMDDQVLKMDDMDLLQVLKGLDSTTGGDNLCDLAGNLGLFNDVDVMNYEEIAVPNLKETDATLDIRSSIEKCHQQMERKCEYLVRRLRKLQSRYMGKHTSEEICGLFEWTNRLVRRKDQHEQIPSLTYEEDKHRPVSATSVRTLLRKIDLVAKAQHSNASDPSSQPLKKYKCSSRSTSSIINSNLLGRDHDKKGSNSSTTSSTANASSTVIKTFDEKTSEEIGYISGLLHSEVRQVQCAFDSDATASSSGGESADEMVTYNNQLQQSLSISKRAGWRWARDRAAIASRWTWLLAQISDLEYRIRQHSELYQHIRKNKGFVALETSNTECSTTVDDLKNANLSKSITEITSTTIDFAGDRNQTDIITSSGDNITINSTNVNGYRGTLLNVNSNNNSIDVESDRKVKLHQISESGDASILTEDEDELLGACRTRAFQRLGFRKRKLLQTANVHTVSKKAARPSTIKCGCQWPFNPCALCTGRPDPTAPRDLPDTMMPAERISLLDPGYHPVLSFTEDVPTSIHIEAILHMPEWQNKLIRSMSKSSKSLGRKSEENNSGHNKSGEPHTKRTYNKSGQKIKDRKDTLATPSTNKIKKSRKNHDYPSGFSHHSGTAQSPQSSSNLSTKNKHRKTSSNMMISSSSLSSGSPNLNSNTFGSSSNKSGLNIPALNNTSTTNPVNGFQSAFAESLLNNFQCDNLDGSSNGVLPRSKNASPTPGNAGNHKPERALERKNRISYDIDNIVIPYSVAASTRVELLPYKEIPTPKWRVIDDDLDETLNDLENVHSSVEAEIESLNKNISDSELSTTKSCFAADDLLTSINKVDNFDDLNTIDSHDNLVQDGIFLNEDDFDEDISAEAIQSRHDRALLEERRKFSTYLKFPWSTRSRANRRIDSRAESSGANTPDPTSPAPHTPSVAGDQESIPSPAAPSTPLAIQGDQTDVDIANINFGHRRERKRTVSSKKDRDIYGMSSSLERRSQSPDPRDIIPPYEPLQFPIPDDIFEKMLQLMPNISDDIDDNSNLISGVDTGIMLNNSNAEIVGKKLNSDKNGSRKNSISLNLSDTFNDNSIYSSTSINNEICKNNNSKNNCLNNSLNNNDNRISSKKTNVTLGSSTFNEYFDSNDKTFILPGESDTDSAESGLEEDPNDPEWKEPE